MYADIINVIGDNLPSGLVLIMAGSGNPCPLAGRDRDAVFMSTRRKVLDRIRKHCPEGRKITMMLANPDENPFRTQSVACIIAGHGLGPRSHPEKNTFLKLREILKPGGRLATAFPLKDGKLGFASSVLGKLNPLRPAAQYSQDLTKVLMTSGCRYIAQLKASAWPFPWIITLGQVRPLAWSRGGKKLQQSSTDQDSGN